MEQSARRENLRISCIPESEGEEHETEDQLAVKGCGVAANAGVQLESRDILTCHRLGRYAEDKVCQTVVIFVVRRKRETVYNGRFSLKKVEGFNDVYINEDLTAMRYSVLMTANDSPTVKKSVVKIWQHCMQDDE